MKKTGESKEKTTKSSVTFRKNKPNSPIVQMNLTTYITMNYTIFASLTKVKNKPNQTQYKPNTNPITERPKMNVNIYYTLGYNNLFRWRGEKTNPIKANTNPVLSAVEWVEWATSRFAKVLLGLRCMLLLLCPKIIRVFPRFNQVVNFSYNFTLVFRVCYSEPIT